jgi:hypothetical protein
MSEQENGNEPSSVPQNETKRLVAIMEVCAVNAERSFLASQQAGQGVERVERAMHNVMRAIKRLADDQLELRSGIPSGWRDRLMLVMFASGLGAAVAAVVFKLAS